jgi:hypothetical protein
MCNRTHGRRERPVKIKNQIIRGNPHAPTYSGSHVSMIHLGKGIQENPKSSSRVKGISSLITNIWHFVEHNIKKRMSLILELWDIAKSSNNIGLRIQNTKEYLNLDLKNDEGLYTDEVVMFTTRVAKLT